METLDFLLFFIIFVDLIFSFGKQKIRQKRIRGLMQLKQTLCPSFFALNCMIYLAAEFFDLVL